MTQTPKPRTRIVVHLEAPPNIGPDRVEADFRMTFRHSVEPWGYVVVSIECPDPTPTEPIGETPDPTLP